MEGDEYLEQILAASYTKEIDQEENVFRTLPFAAAALAIIFTFLVFIRSDVPDRMTGAYSIVVCGLLAIFWTVIASSLCFLWLAVAAKPLQYLSAPNELYRYVTDLRNYYAASRTPATQIEQQIVDDVRSLMIAQYTLGATHNQRINGKRLRARSRAFQTLIVALSVALLVTAIIWIHKLVRGGHIGSFAG